MVVDSAWDLKPEFTLARHTDRLVAGIRFGVCYEVLQECEIHALPFRYENRDCKRVWSAEILPRTPYVTMARNFWAVGRASK